MTDTNADHTAWVAAWAPTPLTPGNTTAPLAMHWEPSSGWYEQWIETTPTGAHAAIHYTYGSALEVITTTLTPSEPFPLTDQYGDNCMWENALPTQVWQHETATAMHLAIGTPDGIRYYTETQV